MALLLCTLKSLNLLLLLLKNAWLPPTLFSIPKVLAKVCFSRIVINRAKSGTVL